MVWHSGNGIGHAANFVTIANKNNTNYHYY